LSSIAETPTVPASGRSSSPQPGVLCRMPPSRTCEPGTHRTMGWVPPSSLRSRVG